MTRIKTAQLDTNSRGFNRDAFWWEITLLRHDQLQPKHYFGFLQAHKGFRFVPPRIMLNLRNARSMTLMEIL